MSEIFEQFSYDFSKLVSIRFYINYPDIDQNIENDVVLTAVMDTYPGTWMEACQTLVDKFDMDLVCVCLTPTGYLMLLESASLTTDAQMDMEEIKKRS